MYHCTLISSAEKGPENRTDNSMSHTPCWGNSSTAYAL